jgi:hypothetical protein
LTAERKTPSFDLLSATYLAIKIVDNIPVYIVIHAVSESEVVGIRDEGHNTSE